MPYKSIFYWRVRASDGRLNELFEHVAVHDARSSGGPPGGGGGVPGGVPTGLAAGRTGWWYPQLRLERRAGGGPRNPGALANSCQSHGGSWQFMDQVVDTLRTYDTRWGYNGKRGNVGDPSHDAIAYNHGGGADQGSSDVYIIDIVAGHCGSSPGPAWIDVTGVTLQSGAIGRWTSRGRF